MHLAQLYEYILESLGRQFIETDLVMMHRCLYAQHVSSLGINHSFKLLRIYLKKKNITIFIFSLITVFQVFLEEHVRIVRCQMSDVPKHFVQFSYKLKSLTQPSFITPKSCNSVILLAKHQLHQTVILHKTRQVSPFGNKLSS